ncbi:MAG: hypothetical protein G01um101431_815 [Parcubacteria group bacterium Gr01-1014_31]|nr:MAG: hypothetical protein G01um101431_815 [Parcubacteria group bacterium Gr01-1014_31]
MNEELPTSRWGLGARATVVAVLAAVAFIRWYVGIDPDAGLTMTAAWQVSQGLVPYRDFFEFHPPGAFYALAGVFQIFGSTYVVAKLFSMLVLALGAVGVDRCARRLLLRPWHRVAALAVWGLLALQFPLVSYSTYAHVGSIWVAWLLVRLHQRSAQGWEALAGFAVLGASAAGVGWLLQTRGAALFLVGLGVAAASRRWQLVAAYLGGSGVALLPGLALPLREFWQQTVVYPAAHYPAINTDQPLWLVLWGGVIVTLGIVAYWARSSWRGFWPLWWTALALLVSIWPHANGVYLSMVLWPLALLFTAAVPPPSAMAWRRLWQGVAAASGAFAGALALMTVGVFFTLFPGARAADPWGARAPFWEDLAVEVRMRTQQNEPIFATPTLPNLYFFAQRPNATRYNSLFSGQYDAPYFLQAVVDLEQRRPRYVVRELDSLAVQLGYHRDGTQVDVYLDEHYRVAAELTKFLPRRLQLLERR